MTIHQDGDGEALEVRGTRILVKVSSERVSVTDHEAPAGFPGPPMHVHPAFDEVFVVLSGTLTVRAADEVHELGAGGTAHVDGSTPHTFANPSDAPVRFMVAIAPGGFEEYFRAMGRGDEEAAAAVAARVGYAPVPAS